MKLKILVDNNTYIDRYFYGEPGVSYFIRDDDKSILFDTGYSDLFIKNAHKMNVNLLNIDYLVISHGHNDHTWGLVPLIKLYAEAEAEKLKYNKPKLIAHPLAFNSKQLNNSDIGSIVDSKILSNQFNIELTKNPIWITKKLVFLGEIKRKHSFENKIPIGKTYNNGVGRPDYLYDDSALVYKTNEGLVIITGCSHSGICNIIEYAMKVCDDNRIIDIIGGFHLLNPSKEQLSNTVEYFSKLNIKQVHACHCTDLKSRIELSKVVDLKEVGVGLELGEYI